MRSRGVTHVCQSSESKNYSGRRNIEMLMIANREVGQRIERKKGFADFMILLFF